MPNVIFFKKVGTTTQEDSVPEETPKRSWLINLLFYWVVLMIFGAFSLVSIIIIKSIIRILSNG